MNTKRRCKFCHQWFLPDCRTCRKQYCCSTETCQKKRKSLTDKNWFLRHPSYEKSRTSKKRAWAWCYPFYWKKWRKEHPEYVYRDNRRRSSNYKTNKLSARLDPIIEFTLNKPLSMLSCIQKLSVRQDMIYRQIKSISQNLPKNNIP